MASKKEFLSIVAATALAASFTMTGCGSSSSSSDDNASSSSSLSSTPGSSSSSSESNSSSSMSSSESSSSESNSSSSSSSSVAPGATMVRVSDAYVIGAVVKSAGGLEAIEVGNGQYEFNTTDVRSGLVSMGGVNDMNGNGAPDAGEPLAPTMKAPIAYTNINPFTTKVVEQEANLSVRYPTAYSTPGDDNLTFNFDVVAKSAQNIELAKEAAKAALSISGYMGDGSMSSSSDANSSSSMTSSSAGSSSSGSVVFPATGRSPFPAGPTSSSSDANTSSSSSEASSSSESGSGDAYARIDNCIDTACINAVVAEYMAQLNGTYQPASSSEASSSEEASSSSEAASSSTGSNPFPAAQR